jgi:hypothetical protein
MEQTIWLKINSKLPDCSDYITRIINNPRRFLAFLFGRFITIRKLVTWLSKKKI